MINKLYLSGIGGLVACGLTACVLLIQPLALAGADAAQDTGDARRFGGSHNHNQKGGQFCTKTANLQLAACRNEN